MQLHRNFPVKLLLPPLIEFFAKKLPAGTVCNEKKKNLGILPGEKRLDHNTLRNTRGYVWRKTEDRRPDGQRSAPLVGYILVLITGHPEMGKSSTKKNKVSPLGHTQAQSRVTTDAICTECQVAPGRPSVSPPFHLQNSLLGSNQSSRSRRNACRRNREGHHPRDGVAGAACFVLYSPPLG